MDDIPARIDGIIADLKDFASAGETARSRGEDARALEVDGSARIRAWLVAANAAALLVCFNTMLNGEICDWVAFRPLILVFVVGVGSAFASVVADRRANAVYRKLMFGAEELTARATRQTGNLEALRAAVAGGDINSAISAMKPISAEITGLNKRAKGLEGFNTGFWHSASGWLELGSVVALASGLIWAVSDPAFVQALCARPT